MKSDLTPKFPLCFDEQQLATINGDLLKVMSRRWGEKGSESKAACIRRMLEGLADAVAVRAALSGITPKDRAALAIVKEQGGVIQAGVLEDMLQAYGYPITQQERPDYRYGSFGQESSFLCCRS